MKTTLRPLTGPEQNAVLMLQDGKPLDVVERETGLRRAEIAAADDLSKQWGALAKSANGTPGAASAFTPAKLDKALLSAPPKPVTPTFRAAQVAPSVSVEAGPSPTVEPAPTPDVESAAAIDEPPVAVEIDVPVYVRGDANATLARAEASADPKMRAEALAIRGFVANLEVRLDRGEKALAVQARVDELRDRLARAERELAELGGEVEPPLAPLLAEKRPGPRAAAPARGEAAGSGVAPRKAKPTAAAPAKGAFTSRDRSSWTHSTEVREWARTKGIVLADRGRIPNHLIDQFLAERAAGAL